MLEPAVLEPAVLEEAVLEEAVLEDALDAVASAGADFAMGQYSR